MCEENFDPLRYSLYHLIEKQEHSTRFRAFVLFHNNAIAAGNVEFYSTDSPRPFETFFIKELYVHETYRKVGIAQRLMDYLENICVSQFNIETSIEIVIQMKKNPWQSAWYVRRGYSATYSKGDYIFLKKTIKIT